MPRVKFGKKVRTETPHRICPPVEDVFAHDVDENAEWFLPLLTVDLKAINPDWSGKAHFLYNEANQEGGVTFKLNGDKYVYEGNYDFDESEMNERDKGSGYVEMIELDVPELTKDNQSDWTDIVYDAVQEAGDSSLGYSNMFGYRPWWAQNNETPKNPDGASMLFVGQIRADDYSDEVTDKDLYLFFCPKYGMVTQIDQCT